MSSSQRITAAKSAITNSGGRSVEQQRSHQRNMFRQRIKNLRIQELDKYRALSPNSELDYKYLLEIKEILGQTNPESLATADEIDEALKEVETLLFFEQLGSEYQDTINEMGAALTPVCKVCDKIFLNGDICEECSNEFNSPF